MLDGIHCSKSVHYRFTYAIILKITAFNDVGVCTSIDGSSRDF
ncbi:hypothetical protein NT6N_08860 [Oceaniferula spumae]|uniref:Uncharacterized protein n=1 Tax=Oceaniferula spumae TaxID=2979115 RepID=A0AAT9FIS6_9BACT